MADRNGIHSRDERNESIKKLRSHKAKAYAGFSVRSWNV